ncbi:MAG TPA: nitroreductase family deazaflavin-dependent oxidoreductase [Anaerolineales bacterium]|nr:nitroreductase family deazaflavin-dependent oxidoreductase [Anaerolineales bacterium]
MSNTPTGNPVFRLIMNVFSGLYRATDGRIGGRMANLNVLLLTTTGRKSGKQRTNPLGYFEHDGGYVVTASNGGADRHPGWFFNLEADPNVRVRIHDKEFPARADVIGAELRKKLWIRLVSLSPQYGNYATSTKREIPLILLRPVKE